MRSKHLLNPLGALLNYCNENEFDHCVNIFPVSGGAEYFGHRLHFITFAAIPILNIFLKYMSNFDARNIIADLSCVQI